MDGRDTGPSGLGAVEDLDPVAERIGEHDQVLDPALVGELIRESGNAVAEARRRLADPSGRELVALIAEDLAALKQQLAAPRSRLALMAGIDALWWLDDHLGEWRAIFRVT